MLRLEEEIERKMEVRKMNEIEKEAVKVILELLYQDCGVVETEEAYTFDSYCISAHENAYKFLKKLGFTTPDSNNRIFKVLKSKAREVGFE